MIYVFFFLFQRYFCIRNDWLDFSYCWKPLYFCTWHAWYENNVGTADIRLLMQSAPVSIRGTDLCALIKRRFIPRAWQLCKRHISTSIVWTYTHTHYSYIHIYIHKSNEQAPNSPPQWNVDTDVVMFAAPISSSNHVCYSSLASNQNGPPLLSSRVILREWTRRIDIRDFHSISRAFGKRSLSVIDAKFSWQKNCERIRDGASFRARIILRAAEAPLACFGLGFGKHVVQSVNRSVWYPRCRGWQRNSQSFSFRKSDNFPWYRIPLRSILHTTSFAVVRHRGYSMTFLEEGSDCIFDLLARRLRVSSIASRGFADVNDASWEAWSCLSSSVKRVSRVEAGISRARWIRVPLDLRRMPREPRIDSLIHKHST